MARRKTPQEIAEKQVRNVEGALNEIRAGIQAVTEAPGVKAAAAQDKMQARLNEAIDNGKWGDNVAAVSLDEWQDKAINKGVNRIVPGLRASQSKLEDFHEQLQAHQDTYLPRLRGMPDTTREDRKQRMLENFEKSSEFSFRRRRR